MFLDSRSLPWVYPQVLLSCPPGKQIAIVSPWVNDLKLNFPNPLRGTHYPPYLSTLLDYLIVERNISISVYYRDDEENDLSKILEGMTNPTNLKLIQRQTSHAKGVATPDLILHGSVNLLWRSFNLNEENVAIDPNDYASVQQAVAGAFNIS